MWANRAGRRLWRRKWFWSAVAVMLVSGAFLGLCWWHNVWSLRGLTAYEGMRRECHPAWKDYHFGRIRAGDAVDDVIEKTQPVRVDRKGRWTILKYHDRGLNFTGMFAAAYDGRMVFACAMSCCWTRLFFDELTEQQSLELLGRPSNDPRRLGINEPVR